MACPACAPGSLRIFRDPRRVAVAPTFNLLEKMKKSRTGAARGSGRTTPKNAQKRQMTPGETRSRHLTSPYANLRQQTPGDAKPRRDTPRYAIKRQSLTMDGGRIARQIATATRRPHIPQATARLLPRVWLR